MDELISDHFWTKDEDIAYLKDFAVENVYLDMPLVNMTYRMLDMAAEGLPLTKVGNPTTAVIEELYPLGPKDFFGKIILKRKWYYLLFHNGLQSGIIYNMLNFSESTKGHSGLPGLEKK